MECNAATIGGKCQSYYFEVMLKNFNIIIDITCWSPRSTATTATRKINGACKSQKEFPIFSTYHRGILISIRNIVELKLNDYCNLYFETIVSVFMRFLLVVLVARNISKDNRMKDMIKQIMQATNNTEINVSREN